MATKLFLFPYKPGSASAKALKETGIMKRIKRENSKFRPRANKTVVNWGCSKLPNLAPCTILNKPEAVALAANKLAFFKRLEAFNNEQEEEAQVRYPTFTTERQTAEAWLEDKGSVVCRTILNGNSGAGIVLVEPEMGGDGIVDAPLYTQYVPKKQEYRIHVFQGDVLDIQRKARCKDVADENVNWKIRNHDNGFIFAREGFECPQDVIDQAVRCVNALGLDFGAVDMIYNDKQQKAYVIEVNTAPGLTGTTLENYTNKFKELI